MFETTAWAINGAQMGAALARRAVYASGAKSGGVVQQADMKVTQLGTPGIGVVIAPGVGVVLNDYQTTPNETYVVSNPSTHTIPSEEMPASSGSARSFIVAVVIGDPDFSQTGHPFMGSDDPPSGEETTFSYVRPILVEVSAGATTLAGNYPHLVLARIDIPASTTTILNSYITDLRQLAQPRSEQQVFVSPGGTWTNGAPRYIPSGSSYGDWGPQEYAPTVKVPSWAKRAILMVHINGVGLEDTSVNVQGGVRAQLGTVTSASTGFDYSVGGGAIRDNLQCAGNFSVTSIAGTTVALRVEGYQNVPASPSTGKRLRLRYGTQIIFDVRFFEE